MMDNPHRVIINRHDFAKYALVILPFLPQPMQKHPLSKNAERKRYYTKFYPLTKNLIEKNFRSLLDKRPFFKYNSN